MEDRMLDVLRSRMEKYTENKDKRTVSERAMLIGQFVDKLNPARVQRGYKPLTAAHVGVLLQGIPTADLYYLDSSCKRAKSYSACWWASVKPLRKKTPQQKLARVNRKNEG